MVRIGVGHNNFQQHSFPCAECHEILEIGLKVDYINTSSEASAIANCHKSNTPEGTIINLHPDFLIPEESQNEDNFFISIHEAQRLISEVPGYQEQLLKSKGIQYPSDGTPPGIGHEWEFTKRVWSLFIKNETELCREYIIREHANYRFNQELTPIAIIREFCRRLIRSHGKHVLGALSLEWAKAKKSAPSEAERFRTYFNTEHLSEFNEGGLIIFSEYMKWYSEFSQVLIYQHFNLEIPSNFIPSSTAFNDIKMFYGNGYEYITSYLVVPTCINNIIERQEYDKFATWSLSNYLKSEKAGRHTAFKNNKNLIILSQCLNNQIRNSSHHGGMTFNSQTNTIKYKTKSAGQQYIKYINYLNLCNSLMQTIIASTYFILENLVDE